MSARCDSGIANGRAATPQNGLPILCNFRDKGMCIYTGGCGTARRIPTVAVRVRAHIMSCGICGGQSDTFFSEYFCFSCHLFKKI
jgi:hypothetical protein